MPAPLARSKSPTGAPAARPWRSSRRSSSPC
jgi:hypothetical protein